ARPTPRRGRADDARATDRASHGRLPRRARRGDDRPGRALSRRDRRRLAFRSRPMITRRLLVLSSLLVGLCLAACSREETPRCRECGMRVDGDPRFLSGATLEGEPILFDTPKCLFRFLAREEGRRATDGWVTEYYSGARR